MDIQTMIMYLVLIVIAVVVAYFLYKVLKTAKNIAINIIIGFIVLIVGNWIVGSYITQYVSSAVPVKYDLMALIITALTGVFGALVLLILAIFGIQI
ncbi:pro-sigmaK processing inhibitor BofA family protein [Methanolapillus ohkumae]